jgi:protein-tyrosine-phosphatase
MLIHMKMKVLFVCTGNIFRSMSAEFLLKDYLKKEGIKGIEVRSAGIIAAPEPVNAFIVSELKGVYGIDASSHKQTRLTKELLQSSDVVIAMAEYHQKFIKEHFGSDVPLFNEFCYGKSVSVWDIDDVIPDWEKNLKAVHNHFRKTIKYIHDSMPILVKKLKK